MRSLACWLLVAGALALAGAATLDRPDATLTLDVHVDLSQVGDEFHLDDWLPRGSARHATYNDVVLAETEAEVRDHEGERLWFHLDDYLKDAQSTTTTNEEGALDMTSGGAEDEEAEAEAPRGRARDFLPRDDGFNGEQERNVRDRKGGTTTVLANKNFMSIMEDMSGNDLDPKAAAEEARLEAEEAARKRDGEQVSKRRREDREKKDMQESQRRESEKREEAAESSKKSALEEVEKAQEGSKKVNERTAQQARQEKENEEKAKREVQMSNGFVLADGWGYLEDGYAVATSEKLGEVCVVQGVLKGTNGYIGRLPNKCAPGRRVIFGLKTAGGHQIARIDVIHDGRVYYVTGPESTWLSLSGMQFPVARLTAIVLAGNWQNYGAGWRDASYRMQNNYCALSGLIREGSWTTFATLPEECRPDARLVFSGNNHRTVTRVDLLPSGEVVYSGGSRDHGWVSLDGILFSPNANRDQQGTALAVSNGWSNFGGVFRPAMVHRSAGMCILSGLIRSDDMQNQITTLPTGCFPEKRLVFSVNSHARSARVDVLPDGGLFYINNAGAAWISLSGIVYIAKS
jgi:hypothetical protein